MSVGIPRGSRTGRIAAGDVATAGLVLLGTAVALAQMGVPRSPRADEAHVYFITPKDGDVVKSPFVPNGSLVR